TLAVTYSHDQGYSRYTSFSRHLSQELTVSVAPKDPVKIMRLRLSNEDTRVRKVTAIYFAEWVLGTQREQTAARVV
ncbi:hypothetical protein ACC687_43050, partial [Rhizobium ruizarguesonis]